jgi:hypothetical protein
VQAPPADQKSRIANQKCLHVVCFDPIYSIRSPPNDHRRESLYPKSSLCQIFAGKSYHFGPGRFFANGFIDFGLVVTIGILVSGDVDANEIPFRPTRQELNAGAISHLCPSVSIRGKNQKKC